MALTRRETRVVDAFINCIEHGEYTEDYAITLIEDNARYGWMSDEAKDYFYERLEELHPEEEPAAEESSEEPAAEESSEEPAAEEPSEEPAEAEGSDEAVTE